MDKRLILAIALSLGVAVGFGLLTELTKDSPPARAAEMPAAAAPPPPATSPPEPPARTADATPAAPQAPPAPAAVEAAVPPPAPAPPAPAPPAPVVATEAPAQAPAPAVATERVENPQVVVSVSSGYGAITSWRLKAPNYYEEVAGFRMPTDLADVPEGILGLHCYDSAATTYVELCPSDYALARTGPDRVTLESLPSATAQIKVRQTYRFGGDGGPYVVRRTVTMEPAVPGTTVRNLVTWMAVGRSEPREKPSGGFLRPEMNVQNGVCRLNGEVDHKTREDIGAGSRSYGVVGFVGVADTYFLSAFGFEKFDPPGRRDSCVLRLDAGGSRPALRATLQFSPVDLSGPRTYELIGYLGPKILGNLRGVTAIPGLDDTIDLGWFSPIAVVMLRVLQFFQGLVVSWGVAIILLTVLVRTLLFPLTHWSVVSMRRMGALKPHMDEINARYKDDKQRRTQAIMELYKTHKVNPLSGCLPLLIQMPIWIALYRAIGNSAELYHTPFLYLPDLTLADPYYILPVVLGIAMFVQQKMSPTTMDSTQAKVMLYAMPIMFTVFMLFLPSGLNVYILASTLLGIVQQQITNRLVPMPSLVAAKGGPGAGTPPAAPQDGGQERPEGPARQRPRRKR